jgi:type II secretory pathway predicted ATPase ExeA
MLIRKSALLPEARAFYHLPAEALLPPWRRDQVWLSGDFRAAYEHLRAKALYGGMLALVGESGAGKTTIKDLLVSDLMEAGEVIVIEPHTQEMEANDKAGKTLKSAALCEAILREVAPGERLKRTTEAKLNQVAAALADSLANNPNRRHLLIIDEAHALPKPTLRHLKRFMELKNPKKRGLARPLLSIVLLGQPELATRLSPFDMEVREVWQRCELVTLPALSRDLAAYVKFRLRGPADGDIFAPEALTRLRELLTRSDGTSFCTPLAIDSWLAAILNRAAGVAKGITAEMVGEVHADVMKAMRGQESGRAGK